MGLLTLKLRQIQQRQSERLYTRISAAQVRRQLIEQKGYRDEDLPTAEVIRQQLNQMGDRQLRVAKTKPQKTIAETEAIFAKVNRVNAAPTEINFILNREKIHPFSFSISLSISTHLLSLLFVVFYTTL